MIEFKILSLALIVFGIVTILELNLVQEKFPLIAKQLRLLNCQVLNISKNYPLQSLINLDKHPKFHFVLRILLWLIILSMIPISKINELGYMAELRSELMILAGILMLLLGGAESNEDFQNAIERIVVRGVFLGVGFYVIIQFIRELGQSEILTLEFYNYSYQIICIIAVIAFGKSFLKVLLTTLNTLIWAITILLIRFSNILVPEKPILGFIVIVGTILLINPVLDILK